MIWRLLLLAACLALVAAACGDDSSESDTVSTTTSTLPTTTTAARPDDGGAAPAAVAVAGSALGDILVDQDGNVLYLFVPDAQGPSVCNDGCAAAWPPLLSGAVAGDGADAALLGTAARDDGAEQVTYNAWPLYYFADDLAPGDTNGQGVNDVWYVVSATGDAIGR
jgi:predicted lipoprotein with Yx(FWY)xxD motif